MTFRLLFTFLFAILTSVPGWCTEAGLAIVLVDMQKDFLTPEPAEIKARFEAERYDRPVGSSVQSVRKNREAKSRAIIGRQLKLLDWAKLHRIPVLVFEYAGHGPTDARLRAKLADFENGRVRFVTKKTDGGFDENEVESIEILRQWGSQSLIVTGVNGDDCVLETAKGAIKYGYRIYSAEDLVGDFSSFYAKWPDRNWESELRYELRGRTHPPLEVFRSSRSILARKFIQACAELLTRTRQRED